MSGWNATVKRIRPGSDSERSCEGHPADEIRISGEPKEYRRDKREGGGSLFVARHELPSRSVRRGRFLPRPRQTAAE